MLSTPENMSFHNKPHQGGRSYGTLDDRNAEDGTLTVLRSRRELGKEFFGGGCF